MPWDYKGNKPDAIKFLHPKIQRKAIKIANAIVREGGDEGIAIATGIKKAKGLVKLAIILPIGLGMIGSQIGRRIGKDKKSKSRNRKIGAWTGFLAGVGGQVAITKHLQKRFAGGYGYAKVTKPKMDPKDFFKEHGTSIKLIKSKADAKKIYREAARKHHPDLGGNVEKFKKLSTHWEDVENSDWFQKLASLRSKVSNYLHGKYGSFIAAQYDHSKMSEYAKNAAQVLKKALSKDDRQLLKNIVK